MGTNYYLHTNICKHCGRGDERLHIGKSSAGWCFSLHVRMPDCSWEDEIPSSLDEWREKWSQPDAEIRDEYGDAVTPQQMEQCITRRTRLKDRELPPEWYAQNHAEPGPNVLARHRIDGRNCIGHGEGTWDLCTGEFS